MTGNSGESAHPDQLSATETAALELIRNRETVIQSELWKALDVSSRTGSRVAQSLADAGLIERAEIAHEGYATYELSPVRRKQGRTSVAGEDEAGSPPAGDIADAKTVRQVLQKRGELPLSQLQRRVDASPEDLEARLQELLDQGVVSVKRQRLYGRDKDVVSLED